MGIDDKIKYTLNALKFHYDMNSYLGTDWFIYFWKPEEYSIKVTKACLSQWYPCTFCVEGIQYDSAEQYMMAKKALMFNDLVTYQKIMSVSDPQTIKKLGREVKRFDEAKWNDEAYYIVVNGNVAKFSQNPKLREYILSTGNKVFAEASPYDHIWGIGMDEEEAKDSYPHIWRGHNRLGFALMEVRDIVRIRDKS